MIQIKISTACMKYELYFEVKCRKPNKIHWNILQHLKSLKIQLHHRTQATPGDMGTPSLSYSAPFPLRPRHCIRRAMELQNSVKSISPLPSTSISPIMASSEIQEGWQEVQVKNKQKTKKNRKMIQDLSGKSLRFWNSGIRFYWSLKNGNFISAVNSASVFGKGSICKGLSFNPTASRSVSKSSAPLTGITSTNTAGFPWISYIQMQTIHLQGNSMMEPILL